MAKSATKMPWGPEHDGGDAKALGLQWEGYRHPFICYMNVSNAGRLGCPVCLVYFYERGDPEYLSDEGDRIWGRKHNCESALWEQLRDKS